MKTSCVFTTLILLFSICLNGVSAAAQCRFSGAVESGAGLFLGEKTGEAVSGDLVLGVKAKDCLFLGLGAGIERRFLLNSEYNPASPNPSPVTIGDFTTPQVLKSNDFSLFLNARYYMGEGRFKPVLDGRTGVAMSLSPYSLGGVFASAGVGWRYDLTEKTGLSLKAFYEAKGGFHADDVYRSMLGWFHAVGLHLAYEF